ncbi:MAG: hypothetical protein ACXWNW_17755 [Isosphaeraceae bacterium]
MATLRRHPMAILATRKTVRPAAGWKGVQHGVAGLTERILVLELQAWYVAIGLLTFNRSKADSAVA